MKLKEWIAYLEIMVSEQPILADLEVIIQDSDEEHYHALPVPGICIGHRAGDDFELEEESTKEVNAVCLWL